MLINAAIPVPVGHDESGLVLIQGSPEIVQGSAHEQVRIEQAIPTFVRVIVHGSEDDIRFAARHLIAPCHSSGSGRVLDDDFRVRGLQFPNLFAVEIQGIHAN
jgi:hypothetical protein